MISKDGMLAAAASRRLVLRATRGHRGGPWSRAVRAGRPVGWRTPASLPKGEAVSFCGLFFFLRVNE